MEPNQELIIGQKLVFKVQVHSAKDTVSGATSIASTGKVLDHSGKLVAKVKVCGGDAPTLTPVQHETTGVSLVYKGAVASFLQRKTLPGEVTRLFENGGYLMLSQVSRNKATECTKKQVSQPDISFAPKTNQPYALSSGDLNPIHTEMTFAKLANLPSTITHGMWTR